MKRTFLAIIASIGIVLCPVAVSMSTSGCKTSQQQTAYKTIYSLEKATTAAYDGYLDLVIAGKVGTNDMPKLAKAYNSFQAAELIALDAVQFNTNALAPANLVIESRDIINFINKIRKDIK